MIVSLQIHMEIFYLRQNIGKKPVVIGKYINEQKRMFLFPVIISLNVR